MEIAIITNVPKKAADGLKIAELYQGRWKIETAFQELEKFLNSEIPSLGYPKAALFGFCVALVSYMVFSVVRAALDSIHGKEAIEMVSSFYIAEEISATYRGMMIAIPEDEWTLFQRMPNSELLEILKELSANVKLSAYRKHPRGPKKPPPKRQSCKKHPHVSTAKIIAARKRKGVAP